MRKAEKIIVVSIILLVSLSGCAGSRYATDSDELTQLISTVDSLFHTPEFKNAFWGVKIKSLETDKVWYELNANKLFMPASNQKIVTTSSALLNLGPDYRFVTYFQTDGKILDSILVGNLIVFSNGDPTIYDRFFDTPEYVFEGWAESLKKMGIKKINGNIVGNDNAFDDRSIGNGWAFDYLDAWYAAEINSLQFNENVLDINVITPKSMDEKIKIEPNVQSDYFEIIDSLEIIDSSDTWLRYYRPYGSNKILLKGQLNANNDTIMVSPSIYNPTLFYTTALYEILEKSGIEISGKPLDIDDIEIDKQAVQNYGVLFEYTSPPLSEIIKMLMKRSQNLYAETMTRVLGYEKFGLGSFRNGRKVVEETMREIGIDDDSYQYEDGSGLSRYDYVSPDAIVKILEFMHASKFHDVWENSFPIAGVDGTLKNRMKNTLAENNVIAKTGTIANVRGLSGYVTTGQGERLVFSFLLNSHTRSTKATDQVTDSVLEKIAAYGK